MNKKDTTCPQCRKKLIFSHDNSYIRCEDLNCPFIMNNICQECNKGKYIHRVATHGYFQGISFFQCTQCKSILNNK